MMLGTAPSLSGFDAAMEAIRVLRVVLSVRCRRAWLRGTARERDSGSHDRSLVSWMHGRHPRVVRHFRTRTFQRALSLSITCAIGTVPIAPFPGKRRPSNPLRD